MDVCPSGQREADKIGSKQSFGSPDILLPHDNLPREKMRATFFPGVM
jgi:hypothetical protein